MRNLHFYFLFIFLLSTVFISLVSPGYSKDQKLSFQDVNHLNSVIEKPKYLAVTSTMNAADMLLMDVVVNDLDNDKKVPLILKDNRFDTQWFKNLTSAWQARYFAEVNNTKPIDMLLINLALGNVELYLTKLDNLVKHLNNTFCNNDAFKKFNVTESLSYNLFNFLSYINTLKNNNDNEVHELLNREFNVYEIVSIMRLTEIDLARKVDYAKKIIIKENLNNKHIEDLAAEYDLLYVQEMVHKKVNQTESTYLSCLDKYVPDMSLEEKILDCDKRYAKNNKDNLLLGVRFCYLDFLKAETKEDKISNIDNITNKLHYKCTNVVDDYLQKYPTDTTFIQKHISFLINFFFMSNN